MSVEELIEILQEAPPEIPVFVLGEEILNIAQFSHNGEKTFLNIDCARIPLGDADQVLYTKHNSF